MIWDSVMSVVSSAKSKSFFFSRLSDRHCPSDRRTWSAYLRASGKALDYGTEDDGRVASKVTVRRKVRELLGLNRRHARHTVKTWTADLTSYGA